MKSVLKTDKLKKMTATLMHLFLPLGHTFSVDVNVVTLRKYIYIFRVHTYIFIYVLSDDYSMATFISDIFNSPLQN